MHARVRALTLIEILIVLSLLIAAGALIVPLFTSTLAEREFDNTLDRVAGHLLAARLESMERRLPIEVIWDGDQLQAHVFDPDQLESIANNSIEGEMSPELELETPSAFSESGEVQPPVELLDLPRGMNCLDSAPVSEEMFGMIESEASGVKPLRIAVFLPDGSVIERGTRWIVDADGRTATLLIDPRTGLPILNRRSPVNQDEDEEDEIEEIPAAMEADASKMEEVD